MHCGSILYLVEDRNKKRIRKLPFFDPTLDEALKNFFTVVTLRVFSLVFFSSNLENVRDWAPWLF